jgi:hypothetical protein
MLNKNTYFEQTFMDINYDGNKANVVIDSNINGKRENVNLTLDNEDLAKILNIPSVNIPLDKRLQNDFQTAYISSPSRDDEFFIPKPKSKSKSKTKSSKSHITYRAYKKHKTPKSSKRRKTHSSKRHSKRHKDTLIDRI